MTQNNESLQYDVSCHKHNIKGGLIISFTLLTLSIWLGISIYKANGELVDTVSMLKAMGFLVVMALLLFVSVLLLKDAWDEYCQLKQKLGEDVYPLKFKIGATIFLSIIILYCVNSIDLIWNDSHHRPILRYPLIILFSIGLFTAIIIIIQEWIHPKK
jgi:heme A synthase